MDFSDYKFRSSQSSKLNTGTIGLTDKQKVEMSLLLDEQATGINANGNKIKWTPTKEEKLKSLIDSDKNKELPKTMITELRKIHRSETYKRNFIFTNKYIQKGISQEEESFSVYGEWLKKFKGFEGILINNKDRYENEFFTGESDSHDTFHKINKWGFDIKTSWDLDTFPFKEDGLNPDYYCQDQVYMNISQTNKKLSPVDKWKTVYVLVNCTEQHLHSEKQKHYYAAGAPSEETDEYFKWIETCKVIERMMIFDYDRFVEINPYHNLEYTREEWHGNGFDIPLEDRVLEFEVDYDQEFMDKLIERVKISRNYLNSLNK